MFLVMISEMVRLSFYDISVGQHKILVHSINDLVSFKTILNSISLLIVSSFLFYFRWLMVWFGYVSCFMFYCCSLCSRYLLCYRLVNLKEFLSNVRV